MAQGAHHIRGAQSGGLRIFVRPSFYVDVSSEVLWLLENANADVARRWHESVWSTVQFLHVQPLVGRLRTDLKHPGIRSWRVQGFHRWLIFYGVQDEMIVLYRVVSGVLDLNALKVG